jgi:hypothetical protein
MNTSLFESLLHEEEGTSLDFKRDQYSFVGSTDDIKSELLKDVLAFANAWRRTDAYILIGVEEVKGGRSKVRGVSQQLNDNDLQQFVNSKTQQPIGFSYEAFSSEGVPVGIIQVFVQDRPFFLKTQYGRVQANTVYLRRGSSTDIALPDEVALMGTSLGDGTNRRAELEALVDELNQFCDLSRRIDIYNRSVTFLTDQYQRTLSLGILTSLPPELRRQIKEVYAEILNADRIIIAAWGSGRGTNQWAEGINEARPRLENARALAAITITALDPYVST